MGKLIVFGTLSIPVVIISWRTLFNIKSHGFYRFFSWECILWLIVNNYRYWFDNPFSIKQIFSWVFLFYSLFLVIIGIKLIKRVGKSQKNRDDDTLYQFEKTTELIETGIYKYIRHPLYGSLLFLTWGIYFKNTTPGLLIISVISTILLYLTARFEEKENITYFGEKYRDYIKKSKMFVPFLI
jgi:protein-S-isoprenylcysteine O-methyltransferase Ste14